MLLGNNTVSFNQQKLAKLSACSLPKRKIRVLLSAAPDSTSADVSNSFQSAIPLEQSAPTVVYRSVESVSSNETAQTSRPLGTAKPLRMRTYETSISTRPEVRQTTEDVSIQGVLAVAGLAGAAVLFFLYRQLFSKKAEVFAKGTADAISQGLQQKKLQKEAMVRLNEMSDQLKSLPAVDLSAQNLGDEGTAYVVEGLAFSGSCQALDLSKNGIALLGINALCQVLPTCGLMTLVLNTNSIGNDGAISFAKVLAGNRLVKKLDLGQNGIGDPGAVALAEALKLNTSVKRLELAGNTIDVEGAKALAAALVDNQTLESLNLSDNYLGEEGALALAEALGKNKGIKELSLRGNEMGDAGVKAICEALIVRNVDVTYLDLGNNSVEGGGADALARLLSIKPTLQELNLYMNDIGDAGIKKIARAVAENKALKTLDVGGNNLSAEGAKELSVLAGHPSLETLELGYNPLGPEGIKAVVQLCKHELKKLRVLKLGWCKAGSGEGARDLADLLIYNPRLSCLDLRGNALGNEGAIALSRGLRQMENTKMDELDLGYNEIKDEGACALAQALKANPEAAVKDLKLGSNYITRFGQVALKEAIDMVYEMGIGRMMTVTF